MRLSVDLLLPVAMALAARSGELNNTTREVWLRMLSSE